MDSSNNSGSDLAHHIHTLHEDAGRHHGVLQGSANLFLQFPVVLRAVAACARRHRPPVLRRTLVPRIRRGPSLRAPGTQGSGPVWISEWCLRRSARSPASFVVAVVVVVFCAESLPRLQHSPAEGVDGDVHGLWRSLAAQLAGSRGVLSRCCKFLPCHARLDGSALLGLLPEAAVLTTSLCKEMDSSPRLSSSSMISWRAHVPLVLQFLVLFGWEQFWTQRWCGLGMRTKLGRPVCQICAACLAVVAFLTSWISGGSNSAS